MLFEMEVLVLSGLCAYNRRKSFSAEIRGFFERHVLTELAGGMAVLSLPMTYRRLFMTDDSFKYLEYRLIIRVACKLLNMDFVVYIVTTDKGFIVNTLKRKLSVFGSALALSFSAYDAQAAVLIDNFTDFQYALDGVQYSDQDGLNVISELNLTGTVLHNAQRSFQAGNPNTEVVSNGGGLSIATDSADLVKIRYTFGDIDLTALASAFSVNLLAFDLFQSSEKLQIQMIANGLSEFGFHELDGIGPYLADFSQFSDSSVFAHLNSLELNIKGPSNWDAKFGSLTTDTKVPEPSVPALFFIGLGALGASKRKKHATA